MTINNHIIHKQTIEIGMPPGKNPFAIQEKVRQLYYEKILSRLDGLFSELITGEVIIRLDRLDLDLGSVDGDRLEQELVERTILTAQKILKEKLQFGTSGSQDMEVIPLRKSSTDVFLYFLEYGRLPWWSRLDDLRSLESAIMETGSAPAILPEQFGELMEKEPVARQRLLFQFSLPFLQYILSSFFPGAASAAPEENITRFRSFYEDREDDGKNDKKDPVQGSADTDIEQTIPDENHPKKRKTPAGEVEPAIYDRKTAADKVDTPAENGENTAAVTMPDGQPLSPLPSSLPASGNSPGSPEANAGPPEINAGSQDINPGSREINDGLPEDYAGKNSDGREAAGDGNKAAGQTGPSPAGNKYSRRNREEQEVIYPELVGLVILHPFLSEFFTALHLLEGKTFRDEEARHKAVHLLGYLATGAEEIQEHRLVFPKVLCGMELANPVQLTGSFTREEREEAEQLLGTVISYWKALKNTSAEGLRDSFLQRQGKLSRKSDGWQLDVEKKTWDILLGKLPWGFSIIKLPWMSGMVFVNWD